MLNSYFREEGINQSISDRGFIENIESLWVDMYERGYIEESDVENVQGKMTGEIDS